MNTNTGEIYEGDRDILDAFSRGEELVPLSPTQAEWARAMDPQERIRDIPALREEYAKWKSEQPDPPTSGRRK